MKINPGSVINKKYTVKKILGKSTSGTTALCLDENKRPCVVKLLNLEMLENWKKYDLFEREVSTLKNLSHPRIPEYLDNFHLKEENNLGLVQEYLEGDNLKTLIKDGRRFSEKEAVRFTKDMLEILIYLQSVHPPVIHRDINPRNIIIGKKDKKPYLVDFDAVHASIASEFGSETVVGTFGYMPMEQIMGKITPATDIYALGITVIYLLTHMEPDDFEISDMKIDFVPHVNIDRGFIRFLDLLIEPDQKNRVQNAEEAMKLLDMYVVNPDQKLNHQEINVTTGFRYNNNSETVIIDEDNIDSAAEKIMNTLDRKILKKMKSEDLEYLKQRMRSKIKNGEITNKKYFVNGKEVSEEEFQNFFYRSDIFNIKRKGNLFQSESDKIFVPAKKTKATVFISSLAKMIAGITFLLGASILLAWYFLSI